MTCPVCGECKQTGVVDSRSECDAVYRWRKCNECGYRFKTVELDADVLERLSATCTTQVRQEKPR